MALRTGLIPPRTMQSEGESALLARLAHGRTRAVEIGVYEGSSALVLAGALPLGAELHLIEPFGKGMDWWEPADEGAVRALVGRAARRRGGPALHWHVTTSERAVGGWHEPIDLLFIDGDHSEAACRLDWDLWHGFVQPGGTVGLLVDEVLGQRNLTDENVPLDEGEDDERYERFVPGRYDLGGTVWGIFRMTTLVKMPDFIQAAA